MLQLHRFVASCKCPVGLLSGSWLPAVKAQVERTYGVKNFMPFSIAMDNPKIKFYAKPGKNLKYLQWVHTSAHAHALLP
jgi:hypothetical protein